MNGSCQKSPEGFPKSENKLRKGYVSLSEEWRDALDVLDVLDSLDDPFLDGETGLGTDIVLSPYEENILVKAFRKDGSYRHFAWLVWLNWEPSGPSAVRRELFFMDRNDILRGAVHVFDLTAPKSLEMRMRLSGKLPPDVVPAAKT